MLTATPMHVKPLPPLPVLAPLPPVPREHGTKAVIPPLFGFQFQRRYEGLYTNRHDKFVLREEHVAELKRIAQERRREHHGRGEGISISDIVNAALDFALEHPMAFQRGSSHDLRESLAREVYCKAFLHFMRHELL